MEKENDISEGSTKLSNFDIRIEAVVLYFYEGLPDVDRMQKSLDETIRRIPILSSVQKEDPDCKTRQKLRFHHVIPSNVKIAVKEVEKEEVFDYYKPRGEESLISLEEGKEFYEHFERIATTPELLTKLNHPVLKVTLLTFSKIKKTILCLSLNHAIADLVSILQFMNTWTALNDGREAPSVECSREWLEGKEIDINTVPQEQLKRLALFHPREGEIVPDYGIRWSTSGELKYLVFNRSRLDSMKKMVEQKGHFSSHDCVCAQLWRIGAMLAPDGSVVPMVIAMNIREVMGHQQYFGNAFLMPSVELTKEEILSCSFSELVWKIRNLIEGIDKDHIESAMSFHEKYGLSYGHFRLQSVFVDDWRAFDRNLPSFIGLDAIRVVANPVKLPVLLHFAYYTRYEEDGIGVIMALKESDYERVVRLDLADPEIVLKSSLDKSVE